MIDFRYHLVSIIAVFLALAVGLVVGSTALSGKAEEALSAAQRAALRNNSALRKDKDELQQEVAADQALASESAARLDAGLLTGERVVLVAAPGADSSVVSGLDKAVRQAGATVTGEVSLASAFVATSAQNEATLSQLAKSLAGNAGLNLTAEPATAVSGQQEAAQVLAASLVSSSASLTSSASEEVLAGLSQNGYISVVSGAPADAPAGLAILVAPGGSSPQSTNQVLMAVAQELKTAGSATVMAGPVSSIGSSSAISAENSAGPAVSTVDSADLETGQITVVWALRDLLEGKAPTAWGAGTSAVIPSPAPTPSVTPSGRASSSPTVKAHG